MEKQVLPHSKNALILGILSIFTACCCYGVIGIVFGIFGILQYKKAEAIYNEDPSQYTGFDNAKTGKITSIIGIVVGVLAMIWMIYLWQSGEYQIMIEQYQEILENSGAE